MQEVFEKIIEKLEEIKSLTPSLVEYQEADDIENRCSELPEPYRPCTNTDCVYNSGNECPASEGCAGYETKGE